MGTKLWGASEQLGVYIKGFAAIAFWRFRPSVRSVVDAAGKCTAPLGYPGAEQYSSIPHAH